MTDTVKTLSALQTLFADNTSGDIDAQDLRDFLVSAMLETSAQSVTTADVTAAAGKHYELDISGMTADRNFTLPASAVVGSEISVKLMTDAPADYELIIKGAATVTINGGSAATEWSRLFIDNEVVRFRATSSTNWDVVHDGRILQKASASLQTSITTNTADTLKQVTGLTEDYDNSNIFSSDEFVVRRTGKYAINFACGPNSGIADQGYYVGQILSGGAVVIDVQVRLSTSAASTRLSANSSKDVSLTAGDDIELHFQAEEADRGARGSSARTYMTIAEVL
jgi:hypothetical protein